MRRSTTAGRCVFRSSGRCEGEIGLPIGEQARVGHRRRRPLELVQMSQCLRRGPRPGRRTGSARSTIRPVSVTAASQGPAGPHPSPGPATPPHPRIGRYELLHQIGVGGMAPSLQPSQGLTGPCVSPRSSSRSRPPAPPTPTADSTTVLAARRGGARRPPHGRVTARCPPWRRPPDRCRVARLAAADAPVGAVTYPRAALISPRGAPPTRLADAVPRGAARRPRGRASFRHSTNNSSARRLTPRSSAP